MIQTPRLTPKRKTVLASMGIENGMDLLTHYPFRYEVVQMIPYKEWKEKENVVFEGKIASSFKTARYGKNRSVTHVTVVTDEEFLDCSIFNRPWIQSIPIGESITIYGRFEGKRKVTVTSYNTVPLNQQLGIHAVYHLKDGINQKTMTQLIKDSYAMNQDELKDWIPDQIRTKYRLLDKKAAMFRIHWPQSLDQAKQAIRTLKYEEFLRFQLAVGIRRKENEGLVQGTRKQVDRKKVQNWIDGLPFELTSDQSQAINTILDDLEKPMPMMRLLQGDVGCGKTLVAIAGMYGAFTAGYQAALMAPTEILAKQHAKTLQKVFADTDCRIGILYSSMPAEEKRTVMRKLNEHEIDIVVGTHALFQESVTFEKLGMVVTDEQQRFGVEQRKNFAAKANNADVLMMSATPIPRTLASSLYGDMDVTTIAEMPKGRKPIITEIIHENSIRSVKETLEERMRQGNQIYFVCAAIEKNEEFAARDTENLYNNLNKIWKDEFGVGWIHGKMKTEEKDETMARFVRKELMALVSTTVIEVGVDVKDANVMVIYDAHRFGLSQLHQLRGRVGRGNGQGYCYLLSDTQEEQSLQRLEIIRKYQDGFLISREDLKLRGPGDLLGIRQSGIPGFLLGNVIEDQNILDTACKDAAWLLENITDFPEVQRVCAQMKRRDG
ncbi:MAG: ATP-dependent DNA helicase RecG [Erysipelotrichaceae bacterium]|nr:ATP-dependent DNA helicase RecG [Erysipelotrichaceae bacterium]